MGRLRLAGFAIALCWLVACGTRRDPDFCCMTEVSCAASGVTVPITPCSDPDRPVCDDNGTMGADQPRTCIADIGGTCTAPAQCTDPARPYCTDNRCVQCEDGDSNDDCVGTTPTCNPSTHLCSPCQTDPDCAGDPGGSVCNVADGSCVECADATDCTTAAASVCDPTDHTCRGCRVDAECASGVCHPDSGECAAPADVLHVTVGGVGTTCTELQPCGTLAQAISIATGTQRVVKLGPGTHGGSLTWTGNRAITIHGAGAAMTTLEYAGPSPTFIDVTGAGASVTLERLKLAGSPPGSSPAVHCQDATFRSFGVHIDAIPRGGIDLLRCSFAIVNTAITRSGGPAATFGAVRIGDVSASHSTRFEFNTLIGNAASGAIVAGVVCNSVIAPVALRSSIIFGNGSVPVTVDPNCPVTYSVLDAATPGATNSSVSPGLTAPEFHLAAGSSAIDRADPAATVGWDLDGDQRPAARDSGADER